MSPVVAATQLCAPQARSAIFTHSVEVWSPLKPVRRWVLQRSDLVFAPSECTLRQLETVQGVARDRVPRQTCDRGTRRYPRNLRRPRQRLPGAVRRRPATDLAIASLVIERRSPKQNGPASIRTCAFELHVRALCPRADTAPRKPDGLVTPGLGSLLALRAKLSIEPKRIM
jgi:hypothetical protein